MPRIMLSYTVHRTRSQHLKDKMGKEFMSLMDISYIQTEMLSIHTTYIYIYPSMNLCFHNSQACCVHKFNFQWTHTIYFSAVNVRQQGGNPLAK